MMFLLNENQEGATRQSLGICRTTTTKLGAVQNVTQYILVIDTFLSAWLKIPKCMSACSQMYEAVNSIG